MLWSTDLEGRCESKWAIKAEANQELYELEKQWKNKRRGQCVHNFSYFTSTLSPSPIHALGRLNTMWT